MQDISGCRIVVANRLDQDFLTDELTRYFPDASLGMITHEIIGDDMQAVVVSRCSAGKDSSARR
jgi:hypothetical protein